MEEFYDIKDLNRHLKNCPAAQAMLPHFHKLWFNGDKIGHPLAHFLRNIHDNIKLIKRYAYTIADDIILDRSEIHIELCKKLELDYNEFKPFESPEIRTLPNREEAEIILWRALSDQAIKILE